MTDEDFKKYVEKWNADFEKTAAEMIQSSFIVDAIAAENNLRCTDLDFTKKLQDYAVQTGIDVARVEEYYGKPELASRLRFQITEEKVLEFLTSKAKIKEVTKA
jgi:trigger factor